MKVNCCFIRSTVIATILRTALCLLFIGGTASLFTASAQNIVSINAASFGSDATLAPSSIVAGFGVFKPLNNQAVGATTIPLPKTLGGVTLKVNNVDAELFFVGTGQINYVIPPNTPAGNNIPVLVTNSDGSTVSGVVKIAAAAPGIFSAKANGTGAAAAQTTVDGLIYKGVTDGSGNVVDIILPQGVTTYLVLYATGVRNAPNTDGNNGNGVAESCKVTIQGVPATVDYAGTQGGFAGVDQLNVRIPPELAGFGVLKVKLTIGTSISNLVDIKIGGSQTDVKSTAITPGQTLQGTLTINDQILKNEAGDTFFFDAYSFSATANQGFAIDVRSTEFDAYVEHYDNNLNYMGFDDNSGAQSNGQVVGSNPLYITVIQNAGNYLIFVSSTDTSPNAVGNYSIRLLSNVVQPISYGSTISNGTISNTDIQIAPGDYLDAYWFAGTQGDRVQIDLSSTSFNAYLVLNRAEGNNVTVDDNSGGGTNARINLTSGLPATGRYIIVATPYAPNVTGNYTLSLVRQTAAPADGEAAESRNEILLPSLPSRDSEEVLKERRATSDRIPRRKVIQ